MRPILFAVLALLAQDPQRAANFFNRAEFDAASPDAEEERKALEILRKRETWISAFRTIEENLGAFPDDLVVKVDFGLTGEEAGWGAGRGAEGQIRFNLKILGDIQRRTAEIEAKSKEAQSRGGKLVYKVPPARIDRVIFHELTHVLQREYKAPDWFNEGMAMILADDPNCIYAFAVANKTVKDIEVPAADRLEVYVRGHLFWKWLGTKNAVRKVVDLTVIQRKDWKEALEEATGLPWSVCVIAEKDWSAGELQNFKPK